MAIVTQFRQIERVLIDADRLADLLRRLGAARAEAYIADRVVEISDRLARIEQRQRRGAHAAVAEDAQRVSQLAADVGLTSLARVARDLRVLSRREDPVAYRAVWQRLVRIGDRSLAQVWEVPGLSL